MYYSNKKLSDVLFLLGYVHINVYKQNEDFSYIYI